MLKFDNRFDEIVTSEYNKLVEFESALRVYSPEGLSPTIETLGNTNIKESRIRRLTPLECFRLQGFPDDFKKPVSDTQLYKQAGNSISVPVIQAILKNLLK